MAACARPLRETSRGAVREGVRKGVREGALRCWCCPALSTAARATRWGTSSSDWCTRGPRDWPPGPLPERRERQQPRRSLEAWPSAPGTTCCGTDRAAAMQRGVGAWARCSVPPASAPCSARSSSAARAHWRRSRRCSSRSRAHTRLRMTGRGKVAPSPSRRRNEAAQQHERTRLMCVCTHLHIAESNMCIFVMNQQCIMLAAQPTSARICSSWRST
mmetsp:Transcript_43715/g.108183  ORF Transcript_43715/g.108183 Transcript_43715/m.108183 type:complete len:217 (-) Transcript_43715:47-697(-)